MQLVDEKNDLTLRVGDFFQKRLETILKFTAKLGAGNHRADVHRDNPFVFQRFRHITRDNSARQPFHDGSFAHAWIAD